MQGGGPASFFLSRFAQRTMKTSSVNKDTVQDDVEWLVSQRDVEKRRVPGERREAI